MNPPIKSSVISTIIITQTAFLPRPGQSHCCGHLPSAKQTPTELVSPEQLQRQSVQPSRTSLYSLLLLLSSFKISPLGVAAGAAASLFTLLGRSIRRRAESQRTPRDRPGHLGWAGWLEGGVSRFMVSGVCLCVRMRTGGCLSESLIIIAQEFPNGSH